jgi:uncharacterized membrane protein YeaQ/YmgE (transglycosylase-associated protein family)
MNFISMLIAGAAAGWLAQSVFRRKAGFLSSLVVGILGALLSGLVLAPLFGTGTVTSGDFSLPALLISFLGALLIAFVATFLQRRKTSPSASPAQVSEVHSQGKVAPSRSKRVFISYRRDGAADVTGRIYDRLS